MYPERNPEEEVVADKESYGPQVVLFLHDPANPKAQYGKKIEKHKEQHNIAHTSRQGYLLNWFGRSRMFHGSRIFVLIHVDGKYGTMIMNRLKCALP